MSDTPALNHDDHWRRLAADLGLDVGPEPEQLAPSARPDAAIPDEESQTSNDFGAAEAELPTPANRGRRRRPTVPQIEPKTEVLDRGFDPTEVEEPPQSRGRRGRAAPARADDGTNERESSDLETGDTVESDEADVEASDVEAAAMPEVDPEAAEEASGEQTAKRRRRRRSRRKKKGDAEPADAIESVRETGNEQPPDGATPGPASDDDEEPADEVVSSWNVPSWDELIASLYRPER